MRKKSSLFIQYCKRKLIKSWSFRLFVLVMIFSYLSALFQATIPPKESKYLYACLTIFANVSFSYIAGYIFYIVSEFYPSSKARFIALQRIVLAEYELLTTIASFSNMGDEKVVANFNTEYNMFKLLYCDSNTYEKCGNDMVRLMANIKIKDFFVEQSKRMLEQTSLIFDCLLVAQNKFLSYEEFICLTKIKRFFSMDNKNFENGSITLRQFEIDQAFLDFYENKKFLIKKLKERVVYCINEEYKQEIESFVIKNSKSE